MKARADAQNARRALQHEAHVSACHFEPEADCVGKCEASKVALGEIRLPQGSVEGREEGSEEGVERARLQQPAALQRVRICHRTQLLRVGTRPTPPSVMELGAEDDGDAADLLSVATRIGELRVGRVARVRLLRRAVAHQLGSRQGQRHDECKRPKEAFP